MDHLFVSSDGALYDTRNPDWSRQEPLRAVFDRHFREIDNCSHQIESAYGND